MWQGAFVIQTKTYFLHQANPATTSAFNITLNILCKKNFSFDFPQHKTLI